jgi:hypothetical protein
MTPLSQQLQAASRSFTLESKVSAKILWRLGNVVVE